MTTLYIPKDGKYEKLEINVDDSSYHFREIMGDDSVVLNFSMADFVDFPIGTYFMYKGTYKYTLYSPQNFKKVHSQHYDYTLTLESELAQLKTIKFKMFVAKYENGIAVKMDTSPRLKFSFTGTPYEFARLMADNLNLSGNQTGWEAVEKNCIASERVTLDFNHDYCYDVLTRIAEAFNTEWEIDGREIRFAKVEKMKESAISLSYGFQNGILGGITRSQFDTSKVINRVWIQGGDRNIRWDTYGNDTLLMPTDSTVRYDGTYFSDENPDKIDSEKAVTYRTDASGCYVERADRTGPLLEDSLDVSKVYPMREGTLSDAYEENGFWYFEDKDIPESLDFSKYVLPNEKMTVIFQKGMLVGREFEVAYTHSKRKFQLIPIEESGLTMPELTKDGKKGTFIPRAKDSTYEGDVYGVFHMGLPKEYIEDAEKRARNEAIKYLYDNAQPKYTYDWQLDGIYAKKEWGVSGGMLGCGNFVRFSDPQFLSEPVDIRITAVKTYLHKLHSPEITISNNVSGKSLGSILNEIPAKEQEIDRGKNEAIEFTKRRFRDAKETMEMLKESLLDFSEGINPITVQTMMMLVGDESLQFRFVDAQNKPINDFQFRYDKENKWLITNNQGAFLQHLTLGIKDITSEEGKEYKTWQMPAAGWKSAPLDANQKCYLYAKCSKTGSTGTFEVSPTAIAMNTEGKPDYYFLLGVLNSEYEGERSYVSLYGFTEILPGRITTDRVVSGDGESYLDLARNAFRIGDDNNCLEYNTDPDKPNTLTVTNATVRKALNVDGVADIAGFQFSNQNIKSEAKTEGIDAMLLDGKNGILQFNNHTKKWTENNEEVIERQYICINSTNDAKIEARNETNNEVAYLSSQGVFANRAGVDTLPASTGVSMKAAIAGLGRGKMDKGYWDENQGIVGVYGTASNSSLNPAPAYGGWFDLLRINGLILNSLVLSDTDAETTILNRNMSMVISIANANKKVYLPSNVYKGTTLYLKTIGTGGITIYPNEGQRLFDHHNAESSIFLEEGHMATAIFIGKMKIGSESMFYNTWILCEY
ncbi:hypothetical protein D0T84_10625 [Dysgonomonas sp. 521]|uniref:phage tail protein n=1 Tax=Dysgonomonas sp. 521 TaxID=2302932 RepID=UPI0013D11347|nr:phage tail protein [Dysgonomonas sp. 521]NDV95368.1 hypothetical protein [Dysgonomonas sp. 521]